MRKAAQHIGKVVRRLTIVVSLGIVSPLTAQTGAETRRAPSIDLSSRVTVRRQPDFARIRILVRQVRPTAREAVSANADVVRSVIDAVNSTGVGGDSITTPTYQVGPSYRNRRGERELEGYFALTEISVIVDDLANIGVAIDAAMQGGADQVPSLVYGLRDLAEPRAEAYSQAVRELRADAEAIASAAGVRLVGLQSITASQVQVAQPRVMAMALEGAPRSRPDLIPGDLGITVSVSASFLVSGFDGEQSH